MDCDHCGEEDATQDLGYLQYCQGCFDRAADAAWEEMKRNGKGKSCRCPPNYSCEACLPKKEGE